jgi:hypothetical protein
MSTRTGRPARPSWANSAPCCVRQSRRCALTTWWRVAQPTTAPRAASPKSTDGLRKSQPGSPPRHRPRPKRSQSVAFSWPDHGCHGHRICAGLSACRSDRREARRRPRVRERPRRGLRAGRRPSSATTRRSGARISAVRSLNDSIFQCRSTAASPECRYTRSLRTVLSRIRLSPER